MELPDSRCYSMSYPLLLQLFFFELAFERIHLNIYPKTRIKTHINISYPDNGKSRDEVATPIIKKHFKTGNTKDEDCHIMTNTIFASKKIEKFSGNKIPAVRLLYEKVSRLMENLFMSNRPGYTGNRDGENEEP